MFKKVLKKKLSEDRLRNGIFLLMIMCMLEGCADMEAQGNTDVAHNKQNIEEDRRLDETDEEKTVCANETTSLEKTSIQKLGEYYQELVLNGRREELEQHVISKMLTCSEAVEMATESPAFAGYAEYGHYEFPSDGVIIVEVDINGDGIKDIIEYLSRVGDINISKYSLTIFMGTESGDYEVMYYQPDFAVEISELGKLCVLKYENSKFLLFEEADSNLYFRLLFGKKYAYLYQIGIDGFSDSLSIKFEYSGIDAELVNCKEEFRDIGNALCQSMRQYYEELLITGHAEREIERDSEDYMLIEEISYNERQMYENKYREYVADENELYFLSEAIGIGLGNAYQSDIDNDGVREIYSKATNRLYMVIGRARLYPFITGELFGKHEGRNGLVYTMVKNGEKTDFEDLCGLDIWCREETPQTFWVENQNGENIVYIHYMKHDGWSGIIEGYAIQDGTYETVLRVHYQVKASVDMDNEEEETKEEGLHYTVRTYSIDTVESMWLFGLENEELQGQLNIEIAEALKEQIEEVKKQIYSDERIFAIRYNVYYASQKKLIIKVRFCHVGDYEGARASGKDIYMTVDLISGEIHFSENFEGEEE